MQQVPEVRAEPCVSSPGLDEVTRPDMEPSEPDPPAVDFEAAYREVPPWEIGRPQPAIASLVVAAAVVGPVLDVGCGTGENALELARSGLEVVAVDSSPAAIAVARSKAAERSLDVEFVVADAYDLSLGRRFATVLDSALLHVIGDRRRYSERLASVMEPDGRLVLLEISDDAPIPYPKISEASIRDAFAPPLWEIDSVSKVHFDTLLGRFPAWLVLITRTAGRPSASSQ